MKLRGLRELQVVVGMMCILLLWHMVINKRRQKSLDIKSVKTTIFAKRRSESPKKVFKTPLKITRTTTRPWSSLRLEGFTAGKNLETTPDVNVNKSTDFCSMHARTSCAHSRSYIDFCLLLFFHLLRDWSRIISRSCCTCCHVLKADRKSILLCSLLATMQLTILITRSRASPQKNRWR